MILASTNFILGSTSNLKVTFLEKKERKIRCLQQFDFLRDSLRGNSSFIFLYLFCIHTQGGELRRQGIGDSRSHERCVRKNS